nr:MAG TPA: hypothetical protein [Caudoviricetes sp.]
MGLPRRRSSHRRRGFLAAASVWELLASTDYTPGR